MAREPERRHRIGLLVPSSNTTLETELPTLLRRQTDRSGHRFSFHSSRLPLRQLTVPALEQSNQSADAAVDLLCDAHVDAIVYGCLAALMSGGRRSVEQMEARLNRRAAAAGEHATAVTGRPAVATSAGALVAALRTLGAATVTLLAPYHHGLTDRVITALAEYGIRVVQSRSFDIVDNAQVSRLDAAKLLALAAQLDFSASDALVISACTQMPSLAVIEEAEQRFGLPVVSATTATAFELLSRLDIDADIANAGSLLRGRHAACRTAASPLVERLR